MNLATIRMAGDEIAWVNQTVVHPVGLAAVLVLGAATLLLPRTRVMLPFVLMACLIAPAQRITLLGLDFNFLRLLVVFGWVRVLSRRETDAFRWQPLDYLVLALAASNTIVYTLQMGSVGALVNRLGLSFDAVGLYFLFRMLVRNWEEVRIAACWFVLAAIPVTVALSVEHTTGRNLFAFLGGVPEITLVRQGRMRCQGAFAHPILAGTFFASLLPLFVALWWSGGGRRLIGVLGIALALLIVFFSASSTPVLATIAAGLGMAAYSLRHRMRLVRWLAVLMTLALHMAMQAPVWHLISRVSAVGGSTGWHRFNLIDNFIRRSGEWVLLGTRSTGHWGYGLQDVTNEYVLAGVRGGLASLILLFLVIAWAFAAAGRAWRSARTEPDRRLGWAVGVMLFVHSVSFIGVSYFGQITMLWYLSLAVAATTASASTVSRTRVVLSSSASKAAVSGPEPQGALQGT